MSGSSSQIAYSTDSAFGCWNWTGRIGSDGYPVVWSHGLPERAHRVVYQRDIGAIPVDHALDHLCRNIICVAPHHLEPVTRSENERRKSWRYRAMRKLCVRGHSLSLTAIITPQGGRVCRSCNP